MTATLPTYHRLVRASPQRGLRRPGPSSALGPTSTPSLRRAGRFGRLPSADGPVPLPLGGYRSPKSGWPPVSYAPRPPSRPGPQLLGRPSCGGLARLVTLQCKPSDKPPGLAVVMDLSSEAAIFFRA